MWPDDAGDKCINIFLRAMAEWHLPFVAEQRVLEIGCAEADWLSVARQSVPLDLWGIDVRAATTSHDQVIRGDVLTHAFLSASFDWIVLISALEHIGLGHYGDPEDPEGDTHCLQRAYDWLKPGGQLYFDVPYCADRFHVQRSHRTYDSHALTGRLMRSAPWIDQHRAYWTRLGWQTVAPEPSQTEYVVCWWSKAA